MSRTVPYRLECTDKCLQAQNDAFNSTFFILRQTGPTAFVIKEDNERIFKVFLGDQHQCTCSIFQRDRELCKHICWLLLKRFRIPRTNSMMWQRGLVEREINELLRGLKRDNNNEERKRFYQEEKITNDDGTDVDHEVEQRELEENEVCPICQEEFLIKKLPITYCRHGCGNNVHVKCMKVWLDHQVSTGEKTIKCPLCREIFGTSEQLRQEFRANGIQQAERASIHLGYSCHHCRACPIAGKCYKCTTCDDYFLCQECFNLNIHREHSFDYREKSFQRWKIATREHLTVLPQALHQMLVNRDINENDYEILIQLENAQNTAVRGVPENIVRALPSERVHERSLLLQPGEQCRLCLRAYQLGQCVRRLPCRHKFHMDCIDGWLLHSHPTCPIDGQLVWSVGMENDQREVKRPSTRNILKRPSHQPNATLLSAQMGLTITSYRVQTALHPASNQCFSRRHPLRALISPLPLTFSSPLTINARNIPKRPISTQVAQRQLLLSSPSLVTDDLQRLNLNGNQDSRLTTDVLHYRLPQRRHSTTK